MLFLQVFKTITKPFVKYFLFVFEIQTFNKISKTINN